eukprot:Em0011g530a
MQQSQPPAEKRQRLLCTSATNAVACNESVAIACEESVAEPNHRLPKPFCRGYLPDLPSPFVQNWAFAAHGLQLPFTFEQSGLRALDCERFAPYGYASCDPCTRLKYNIKGINPRHYIFRSTNASKKASSDFPSASSLSKQPNCFESDSQIKEENYLALQSANISSYQLQDILKLKEFTDNDEADSAVFVANLFKDSKSEVRLVHQETNGLLKHVVYSSNGSSYLVELRTHLTAAKRHLMPWLCSTTIIPDISLYKLNDPQTKEKSDLPIAIFEVISDTPWQTSRQLAIKLMELLRLFRAFGHDVLELTGVVLPRSKSLTVRNTPQPVINESHEEFSSSVVEISAAMFQVKISDKGSASKSTPSNQSQSFAVEVKVRFDCTQLKFVISYQPLESTDVIRAVKSAPLDIEISSHSNSNFFQLNEKELEQIRETLSAVMIEDYQGLNMSVALQQLYSRTAFVFKAQTGTQKEIVLKVFVHGKAEYMSIENAVKKLKLQHALLSEGILSLGAVGEAIDIFVFECLPQKSKYEAKDCMRDALDAIKLAVEELHSRDVAHLDIRLPNICFKSTSGLVAVLIDLERAKGPIKSILPGSYSSCMYRTGWTLEDIDFLQVYWMALWLLLDDVHVSKVGYHSMDTLEAADLSPECCKGLCNWIKGLKSPLPKDHWNQFLTFI